MAAKGVVPQKEIIEIGEWQPKEKWKYNLK